MNYTRTKDFNPDLKIEDPAINKLYPNNVVEYFAFDKKFEIEAEQVNNYKDDVTEEQESQIQEKFPFSEGAPRWVIAYLRQWNNWKNIRDVIFYGNYGGIRVKEKPNQRRMSFL